MKVNKIRQRLEMITHAVVKKDNRGDLSIQIYSDNTNLTKGRRLWQQCNGTETWVGQSEDGVLVDAFWHDGTGNCNGGYGGASFELTMVDGSHKVLCGPWSGRPSVHMYNGSPEYMELTVNYGPFGVAIRGFSEKQGFSREFVGAIINKFQLDVHIVKVQHRDEDLFNFDGEEHIEIELEIRDSLVN